MMLRGDVGVPASDAERRAPVVLGQSAPRFSVATGATRWLAGLLAAITVTASMAGSDAAASSTSLVFGVVPQETPAVLARKWIGLLRAIGSSAGIQLTFATAPSIPEFEACLLAGEYDAAYMNPGHYILASQHRGYRAFARDSQTLQGIIVARRDKNFKSVRDLDGLTMSFPAPGAFAASVIPRLQLRTLSIKVDPIYSQNHASAYRNALVGLSDAAGGIMRTFSQLPDEDANKLEILYRTPTYTSHAWAVRKDVLPEVAAKLASSAEFVSQARPDLLAPLSMSRLTAATDKDWNDVRGLLLTSEDLQMNWSEPTGICR